MFTSACVIKLVTRLVIRKSFSLENIRSLLISVLANGIKLPHEKSDWLAWWLKCPSYQLKISDQFLVEPLGNFLRAQNSFIQHSCL